MPFENVVFFKNVLKYHVMDCLLGRKNYALEISLSIVLAMLQSVYYLEGQELADIFFNQFSRAVFRLG